MENKVGKSDAYIKGYQILLEQGMQPESIDTLKDSLVEGTYEFEEYFAGRMKGHKNDILVTESGEKVLGPDYEGYVNESYNEAVIREAAENK